MLADTDSQLSNRSKSNLNVRYCVLQHSEHAYCDIWLVELDALSADIPVWARDRVVDMSMNVDNVICLKWCTVCIWFSMTYLTEYIRNQAPELNNSQMTNYKLIS